MWSQEYQRTETGIKASIFGKKIDVEVQWFNANSLRVLKMPHGQSVDKKSLSVIARPEKTALKVSTSEDGNIVMKSRLLTVKLDTKTGVLIYETRNGMPLLKELENVKAFIPVNDAGRATYSVYQSFKTDKDEGLYGLGQLQNGQMMQRGIEKYLVQGNTEDVTPVFQSTKGYGVFWDNYAGTMYVDNEEETSFRSDVGDCIDYYFMYGGSADGVIAQIRLLTGSVPMMPLWSYGFMQSKERYKSQDEVVSVVKKYRELGIPLDCIIQDWQYWGSNYLWNAMEFLNYEYRDPKRMIDEVHGLNAHVTVGGVSDHQRALTRDKRVIILTRSGFLGQQRYGSNVWTGDVGSSWDMFRRQITAGLNFSLTGMPHWNTDLGGFFAGSYNNSLGGGTATKNPMFHELYVRWAQFGVFCPMMRSHGADAPREIFLYGKAGEPVYDALVDAIKLRYSLMPYIYSTSWEVSHRNSTFMRALFMDFLSDPKTWNMGSEYMFGSSFLVAPVLHAQYTPEQAQQILKENEGWGCKAQESDIPLLSVDFTQSKEMELYLPAGSQWYDFWTNEVAEGGQKLKVTTVFNRIPLYVRAGSIVPLGPDVQYVTEKKWDNLKVCVYPGADGNFVLYEDEGNNYNYENGAYTEIPMTWNDAKRTLTIDARRGCYEGMLDERKFTVRMPDGSEKTVLYKGKKINVKF